MATTCTETHGGNSGTRATELVRRDRDGVRRRDAARAHPRARDPGLAGPQRRPARRRRADGGGWIPRRASVLVVLGPRRATHDHRRATRGWGSLALSDARCTARRLDRDSRADRRVLRLAPARRRPAVSRGRWVRRRPAASNPTPPAQQQE